VKRKNAQALVVQRGQGCGPFERAPEPTTRVDSPRPGFKSRPVHFSELPRCQTATSTEFEVVHRCTSRGLKLEYQLRGGAKATRFVSEAPEEAQAEGGEGSLPKWLRRERFGLRKELEEVGKTYALDLNFGDLERIEQIQNIRVEYLDEVEFEDEAEKLKISSDDAEYLNSEAPLVNY